MYQEDMGGGAAGVSELLRVDEDNQFHNRSVGNTADTSASEFVGGEVIMGPSGMGLKSEYNGVEREPFDDGWGNYDEYSPSSYMA